MLLSRGLSYCVCCVGVLYFVSIFMLLLFGVL